MARRCPNPIQNISGLSQGPAQPFGGMLIIGHRSVYDRRRSTMNEQAVQERRGRGLKVAEIAFYSVLVPLIMFLYVYVSASNARPERPRRQMRPLTGQAAH